MNAIIPFITTGILAALSVWGINLASKLNTGSVIGVGFVIWFVVLLLIVTPIRMLKERANRIQKLEAKVIEVTGFDEYVTPQPDAIKWLRLKVENPSALPIQDCYGKLMDRRLLFQDARVRETGQDKEFNDSFPPVGHLLIWYDKEQQEITLPLNRSPVFLKVVAMKNKYLCTATMQGGDYPQVPLGDYEFIIEFGSKSEALRQTTKRFQFTADLNGKLSGNILEDITLPNPDKEGSQSE